MKAGPSFKVGSSGKSTQSLPNHELAKSKGTTQGKNATKETSPFSMGTAFKGGMIIQENKKRRFRSNENERPAVPGESSNTTDTDKQAMIVFGQTTQQQNIDDDYLKRLGVSGPHEEHDT